MPKLEFDVAEGLQLVGDLVRLTAPPASHEEICGQGLSLAARTLGASGSLLLLRPAPGAPAAVAATWGTTGPEAARAGEKALADFETIEEKGGDRRLPSRVALLLPGDAEAMGALVLERPSHWDGEARAVACLAARALGSSLLAARLIGEGRQQRELLARRNVELEVLREVAGRLSGLRREDEMLQAALDLVLEKLGLGAGWIFWGESSGGKLALAAARGVSEEFVRRSRAEGVGVCLCVDVFDTGKLRLARNTTECPRLPELVCGHEPMTHACVPLKFERGTLGVMNIANRSGQVFSRQELQFLETFGHQVCLAVDKLRTARAESRRNAEAQALVALARAIGGSLERDRVLAAVGEYARDLLSADRCAIFLGDAEAPLQLAYLSGAPLSGLEVGRPADLAAVGSRALLGALRERRSMVMHNAVEDPRANGDLARRWNIGSAILVPLVSHDRLQGLLQADRSRPSVWNPEEIDLADALAGQAAVAIENAQLYREAQEAFLRLQQAQYGMMRAERLAAVGTLASSLAHEVRNPLNSISLQLVLLSRRAGRLAAPERSEINDLVETSRREIARLDGLVEEFLSLSTIDRLARTEADPAQVVREVLGLMTPVARVKGIAVSERLAEALPSLLLDTEKMKQVLLNLVRNAIEAMSSGGTLTLWTRASSDAVQIGVTDTGVGIDPSLDVFDFFVTTKRGGTGLGLPIARRIVEAHGGTLTYESEPGRGTTFLVTLKAN
ncbi:MAG TPA: GAF domain-containing protein [Candidatus Polarisedimenticolia bacterium]|nr:GAF domain-containing protein [Candidatus Polarisedimenticolia bacterium]